MAIITELIARARAGETGASEQLFTELYADLYRLAQRQVGQRDGHVSSLVHEAYFRLIRPDALSVNDRSHFFAVAARAMRQLVLSQARARQTNKRDGVELGLEQVHPAELYTEQDLDAFALEQALKKMAAVAPELVQLVELRFFAGMELAEIAELMQRSERSLKRDWRKARAYLHAQLQERSAESEALMPLADAHEF